MSYQVDSYGNAYFSAGVSVASIPATTGTQNKVLVPGPGGRISSASIAQLITQSGGNLVSSVYGRTGAVVARQGDYNTDLVTEGQALYFTDSRARKALSVTTFNTSGPATYDSTTGIINIPQYGSGIVGNYVPVTRTITINGQTADLSANRIFSIDSMVYPSAGIPLSNGTSWGTSIVNNSANWNTAFGWGDHSVEGYLTSFTETDPTVASHIKAITTTNITNWNSAHSWGNHALAGYLTSFTETDPIWTSEKINYYTKLQADARYLQSYTETDPVWTSEKVNYYTKTAADARYLQSYTETDPVWTSEKANYALKTYVDTSISNLIDSAPGTLDTLNELAAALGDDANFSTTITTLIGTKEPAITAGTTAQYWRGDKTWQTLPTYTLSGLGGVPTTRTLTINGTSYDLSADRSWSITSMIYPSAGIAVSTGSAWGTSITDNSSNWNTAYSWGNHASAGYLTASSAASTYLTISNASSTYLSQSSANSIYLNKTDAASTYLSQSSANTIYLNKTDAASTYLSQSSAASLYLSITNASSTYLSQSSAALTYVSLSGSYSNPSWVTSLAWSKITGAPAFITGNQNITLSGDVTGSGATSIVTTIANNAITTAKINNGAVTAAKLATFGAGEGIYWAANTDGASIIFESTGDGASGGRALSNLLIALTDNGDEGLKVTTTGAELLYVNTNQFQYKGSNIWTAASLTNLNQLTNGPGYITGITSSNVTTALGYTPYNATNPNGYITGYTETDTLASVTSRGSTTSNAITISGVDSALKVQHDGTSTAWRGRLGSFNSSADKASFLGNYTGRPGVFGHNNALSAWAELYVNTLGIYGQGDVYLSWFTYVKGNGNDTNYSIWHAGNLTNLNQLSNGPGYITGITSANVTNALGYTPYNSSNPSGYITSSATISGASARISSRDNRTISPSEDNAAELRFGFTSWANNEGAPYADYLHLRSYSDSSGGSDNLVMFLKSGIGMRIWQQSFGSGTAYSSYADVWHSGNLTNLNQLTNGPGYVTGGPYLPTAGGSISGALSIAGNITVSSSNTTGGGIILADDGDIVDLNDAYCSMRFSYGVRIFSANRGGTPVITLANTGAITANGPISASNISSSIITNYIVQRDANGYIYANHINFNTSENENPTISSFITSNGDGWSRKSNLAHVKNSIRGVADGTWGISISGSAAQLGGWSLQNVVPYHSGSDFPNGTLVVTNINATVTYGDSFVMEVTGKSYGSGAGPFALLLEGYIYADTFINVGALSYGGYFPGPIRILNYGGNLAFWWPRASYWNSFSVKVREAGGSASNRVTSISDSTEPSSSKKVSITPVQSLHSSNYNSYSPTLTGGNASGTWGINITGSASTLSNNATISGLNFGGVLALTGSGASTGNSTGARLSESYGPIWNLSNGATWHHQVINGSYLSGISAGGGNYGSGNYYGTGDVTAYYSDERLKTKITIITDAIQKIKSLEGFVYVENELARSLGYTNEKEQAGVSAQQIQAVLPQAVSLAPFDMQGVPETGEIISKTGENYLTVKYDRIVPLLIEGIKEQQAQIEELKNEIKELKNK